jgi:DNA-binding transcriptional ArsR family regulator
MDYGRMRRQAKRAGTLLKAIANENRLLILCQLVDGEMSVGELGKRLDLSQSALSQHLARLRRDGVVKTRRQAQTIRYAIASDEAKILISEMYRLFCGDVKER